MTDWKTSFADVRITTDESKLGDRVLKAEADITARLLELRHAEGHEEEIRDLRLAASELRRIQVEKLGYPDLKKR